MKKMMTILHAAFKDEIDIFKFLEEKGALLPQQFKWHSEILP